MKALSRFNSQKLIRVVHSWLLPTYYEWLERGKAYAKHNYTKKKIIWAGMALIYAENKNISINVHA